MEVKHEGDFSYIEEGSGEPIIILHGLFGGLSNFDTVVDRFKSKFRVLIPMLPIYTLPVLNTNVGNLAKFLGKFMDFKQIDKANLLGNSLGGHISLVFAKNNPNRVSRLLLTGSSGLYENAFGGTTPRRGDREFIRKKIEVTFYDPAMTTDDLVEEVFGIINDRGKLIRVLALAKSAIRHNMAADLPNMKMNTCLIWGKNDVVTPPEVAEDFNKLMPNSDLFWIDKCGHAPMMEHPLEFNEIMAAWMEKQTRLKV
jgi:pimeloyl-ACP methyl ester carboxylesterase